MQRGVWTTCLLAVAGFKLVLGLVAFGWTLTGPTPVFSDTALPAQLFLGLSLAFAVSGFGLVHYGQGDRRAVALGSFFILLATVFTTRPLHALAATETVPLLAWSARLALAANVDAFLAWVFWLFAAEFPERLVAVRSQRFFRFGQVASLALGVVLLAWQTLADISWMAKGPWAPLEKPRYEFYLPLLIAVVVPLVLVLVRTLGTRGDEGRRARVFAAGLAIGLGPMFAQIAVEAMWPAYSAFMSQGNRRTLVARFVFFPCLLSVPFTTAYAVLVHRVLQVRQIARRAIQYALARYSAIALAVVPLLALAAYLFLNSDRQLREIFSGARLPLLVAAAAIGFAALRYRRTLLDAIDRQFFREQYDARRILTLLVERIRATRSPADLAQLVTREIDLALHLDRIALLAFDPRSGQLADPRERGLRLDGSSPLVSLIAAGSEPVPVDLEDARSPFGRLAEPDRHWLVDSGFRLLVPILARDGSLLGLIGLGEKKSGLPFLKEDRQLLRAIASNAAWVLELELGRSMRSWQDTPPTVPGAGGAFAAEETPLPPVELAKDCPQCGRVFQSFTVFCSGCSRRLEPAPVPFTLAGKFRFERRIGTGGMGVVYRASDLALGRPVAIKTLRRVSPEDAMRLRREARTAASVSHNHLAAVYGMETWQGTPLLVMEMLEGGTLSQRIEGGPLDPFAVVELGIAMSEALEHLHRADILHRDVKPSNIGFTREGVPKLMDFGIARAMFDMRKDLHALASSDEGGLSLDPTTSVFPETQGLSASHQLVGTLGYLSPEAIDGKTADVSFDLWGLAIVLYECLLGRKVFSGDVHQVMARIHQGRVPDFSQVLPDGAPAFGDFFRCSLHRTVSRRPGSARELRERLVGLRERLGAPAAPR